MNDDKNLQEFLNALGFRESSGKYDNDKNPDYHGMYQLGKLALCEAGYYDLKSNKFTGKNGIKSKDDFLKSPKAQEDAVRIFEKSQWKQIKSKGLDNYAGQNINGIKITESGLIAASHLVGTSAVSTYLKSNGTNKPKDGYGTSAEEYLKNFSGYDVSEITNTTKPLSSKTSYKDIEKTSHNDVYNGYISKSVLKNVDKGSAVEELLEEAEPNFLQKLRNKQKEKIEYYTARLAQSEPFDDSQGEPKPTGHNLKEVLAQQKEKLKENTKRLFEGSGLEKRFRGEIPKDYVNEESGDNKIFTLEQVNAMDESDKKKYEKAIAYQKRVVGLPTERQAQKSAESGGMVKVNSYTRSDGTEVKSYYRSR